MSMRSSCAGDFCARGTQPSHPHGSVRRARPQRAHGGPSGLEVLEPRFLLSGSLLDHSGLPFVEGVGWQVSGDAYLAPATAYQVEPAAATGPAAADALGGSPAGQAPFGADYLDSSEYMIGDVWVTVVLLESTGAIDAQSENWTDLEITQVKDEIREGLTWWEDTYAAQNPGSPHHLTLSIDFTYADSPVQTGYEPITRPYGDQTLWIDDFLDQVGYNTANSIWTDLYHWNHDQRLAHNADWAYTVFVVDSSLDSDNKFSDGYFAYAYLGGPFTVMTYGNNGWGITRMGQVLAHETGHIFYALDEYPSSRSYDATSGYYNVQNLNAYDDSPDLGSRVDSIMAEASLQSAAYAAHTSSPTSLEMLGWRDGDSDGVFDVLDTPLTLTGSGAYDEALRRYTFSGSSAVTTLENLNPYGYRHDITINTVDTLQYRLDAGDWVNGSVYGTYSAAVSQIVDGSALADGNHTIEFRTVVDETGVASNIIADTFTVANTPNLAPVGQDDTAGTNEDTPVTVDVLANDSDGDGDLLFVDSVTQPLSGSVVIETDDAITYTPAPDFHGADSFTYTLADGRGGTDTATVTVVIAPISDISILPADANRTEGDAGTTSFGFDIRLDEPTETTVSVDWIVAGTGADPADAADFGGTLPAGQVTFLPGQTLQAIAVPVTGDTEVEPDEEFLVTLSNPSAGATVASGPATGVIANDDIPPVSEYIDSAAGETTTYGTVTGALEGTYVAGDDLAETVTEELYQRDRRARLEHSWSFNVTGGGLGVSFHLLAGHDSSEETFHFEYDAQDGTGWQPLVTLSTGAMTAYSVDLPSSLAGQVLVRVIDTVSKESAPSAVTIDEMYFLSRHAGSLPPRVAIRATDDSASETGPDTGEFLIELVGGEVLDTDLTVHYTTAGSTADSEDYLEAFEGTAVIEAGQFSAALPVTPVNDTRAEGTETLQLTLIADPAYDTDVADQASVRIADDDLVLFVAASEQTLYGSAAGTYLDTHAQDGVYETLTEERYSPGNQMSRIEHWWTYDLANRGPVDFVVAAEVLTSDDVDHFVFEMSTDGGQTWTALVTVTPSSPVVQVYTSALPPMEGTVLVRVVDTVSERGDRTAGQLRIDYLAFTPVGTETPLAVDTAQTDDRAAPGRDQAHAWQVGAINRSVRMGTAGTSSRRRADLTSPALGSAVPRKPTGKNEKAVDALAIAELAPLDVWPVASPL